MKFSIIIPVLNESSHVPGVLKQVQAFRKQGHEVILVDGGSQDDTLIKSKPHVDCVINSPRGRAVQMNAGAASSTGDVLLFLHADTMLPQDACDSIQKVILQGNVWGRFDVRLSSDYWAFRIIETMMNWRSCLTSIATGDQAIFVHRTLFLEVGGYPEIDLMEDIALCRQLKKLSRPACIRERVISSSRKWEKNGILKTIFLMWRLRIMYFMGVSPHKLAKQYYG